MLTYIADVFGHALVVSFLFGDKLRYNGGSFFVKGESILNKFQWWDIIEKGVTVYLSKGVSI